VKEKRISGIGQIKVYAAKCFRLFMADRQWKNFVSAFIIIFLICLVTGDDMFREYTATKKGAFAVICACIWVGLFNSIQSVCHERAIIKREHRTGLRISSYICAHVIYEFALCALETLILFTAFMLRNLQNIPKPNGSIGTPAFDIYVTMLLVVFGSDMLALIISCTVKKESTAMTVMPFVLIIQLIMSGMLFDLEGVTEVISRFTLSRWGLNAIMTVANTNDNVRSGYDIAVRDDAIAAACEPNATNVLHKWMILAGFALLYIVISIIMLRRVDKDKR